jgi:glutamine synthetase
MIRIPAPGEGAEQATRVELRFPDPSCNPYLAFAAMLLAGLDGIDRKLACPPPMNNLNIYEMSAEELSEKGIAQLPGSLAEALQTLAEDTVLVQALGAEIYEAFVRAKTAEWDEYRIRVMDWEVERYLETA